MPRNRYTCAACALSAPSVCFEHMPRSIEEEQQQQAEDKARAEAFARQREQDAKGGMAAYDALLYSAEELESRRDFEARWKAIQARKVTA